VIDLPPPDPSIEIVLASRGISKGLAQTEGPQALVRAELGLGPAYVGAYAKNVTSPTSDGEAGALIGLRTGLAGFDLAASAAWKRSIAPTRGVDAGALELAGSAGRRMGPVTLKLGLTWSPNDLGSTGRSTFAEATFGYSLDRKTSFGASVARRERDGGPDYTAFNAGATRVLRPGISADLRYYDTARSGLGDPYAKRLVASVRAKF
jgi:hypothetical protein